ncbi:MAG: head-tail connector protein [Lachnospiraceae bacterium]|nr:head-tail connector protein [Lachnospiraceae bacterium]MCM1230004.1 head-tail connector protein [Ruminococcus flavefaciens]
MVTLGEAKNYLRVGYEEDDKLIQSLLDTAKRLVMDVGRIDESGFEIHEDVTRTAVLSALGYLYENRSNPDYHWLTLSLRNILFAVREGKF